MASQKDQQTSQVNSGYSTGNQVVMGGDGTANVGVNSIYNNIYNASSVEKPTLDFPKNILLLSANPHNPEGWARSRENLAEIEKVLDKATRYRIDKRKTPPAFALVCNELHTEAGEVSQKLAAIEPYIIDIFGFEDGLVNLVLERSFQSNQGKSAELLIEDLFRISSPTTKCMVLNGCYLEKQARKIVQHVDYLIGIDQLVSPEAILLFLNDFYFYVGLGIPVSVAYEAGCNRVLRRGLDNTQIPFLLTKIEETSRKNREQKLSVLADEIEEAPDNAEKRIEKGDLLEESGRYEKAALAYREALRIDDENYKAWWKYGIAQANVGNYIEAKEAYDNALSFHLPFSDEYIIRREHGSILKQIKEFKRSLASYKRSLQLEPRYRVASYEKRKVYKNSYFKTR